MCIQGGFKTVTPIEISNVLSALGAGDITTRGARVYLGCLAMVAVREGAKRSKTVRRKEKPQSVRFQSGELSRLTEIPEKVVKRELRSLERQSLLKFGEQAIEFSRVVRGDSDALLAALSGRRSRLRPIPIPRTLLRHLARNGTRSLVTTALVYAARGLSLSRTGELKGAGTVKASWIASATGLSLRAVKAGRKALIVSGFISKDEGSFQRKLNRDGAYFVINFAWRGATGTRRVHLTKPITGSDSRATPTFAPPRSRNDAVFAPPYKDWKTSSYEESKNQNAQAHALKPIGFSKKIEGEKPRVVVPTIRNILPSDLTNISSVDALYWQAVRAGWLKSSEAGRLNWFGAAVRAISTEARDPVRVFVSIVKRKAWFLITYAHEERARRGINKLSDALR